MKSDDPLTSRNAMDPPGCTVREWTNDREIEFPEDFLLSVIIPIYNEAETVSEVIDRVLATKIPCEIIAVDDGSSDGSATILNALARDVSALRLITHPQNLGKGAAVRSGCAAAQGTCVLIQDADLEYDPRDYPQLLAPILNGQADVVYGSRFLTPATGKRKSWHRWGNSLITWASNRFTRLELSDVETGYKVLRKDRLDAVLPELSEDGFGIELELTAAIARRGYRIVEVPVKYQGRSYADGKKIGVRDALRALWCIVRN
jgi:glycosyltransferase involved in cell wall biosynthesis